MPDIERVMTELRTWARLRRATADAGYTVLAVDENAPKEVQDLIASENRLLNFLPESER